MRRRAAQSGFALLVALVLVLLAGVALAGIARRSTVAALEARSAAEDLRRRWAVASCRATLLPRVERVLREAEGRLVDLDEGEEPPSEDAYGRPVPEKRIICRLAGLEYELVMTDEQAKLNVNRLVESLDPDEAEAAVEALIRGAAGAVPADVRLRPIPDDEDEADEPDAAVGLPPVGAYGQVFQDVPPERLLGLRPGEGLASNLTCWGRTQVHLARASARAIEGACGEAVDPRAVRALIEARNRRPFRSPAMLMGGLDQVDADERGKLAGHVTGESFCHGLWIIARGTQRDWHTLVVGISTRDRSGRDEEVHDDARRVVERYEFSW